MSAEELLEDLGVATKPVGKEKWPLMIIVHGSYLSLEKNGLFVPLDLKCSGIALDQMSRPIFRKMLSAARFVLDGKRLVWGKT